VEVATRKGILFIHIKKEVNRDDNQTNLMLADLLINEALKCMIHHWLLKILASCKDLGLGQNQMVKRIAFQANHLSRLQV
jgi:hypothetical protein